MSLDELLEKINSQDRVTYVLEPQDEFNEAIIGYEPQSGCLVYSVEALFTVYCKSWGVEENSETWAEVMDFIGYNISFGSLTPLLWYNDGFDETVIPEDHFAVYNYEHEIRVLPFLANWCKNTTIE